ncbi:unnamed protein product [Peronospora destructor]|uniref:PLAC8 motif-containing protein n=1 Tax=Peronospora destructor TaxID=86335 RepID=A0AAV0T2L6_9STRA|nr:unnamed protein product [Peronospora destructor]
MICRGISVRHTFDEVEVDKQHLLPAFRTSLLLLIYSSFTYLFHNLLITTMSLIPSPEIIEHPCKSPTPSPTVNEVDHPYVIQVDASMTPTGNPNGETFARDNGLSDIKIGGWETNLCGGCFKHCVPNCCMVTFCPCVTHAQISSRLGMAPYWCALATLLILIMLTCGTVHLILFIWIWKARSLTRERFHIPGGRCRDCCASLFCPCCTLAQIATHIKSYQPGSCDFGPPDTLPPYSRI